MNHILYEIMEILGSALIILVLLILLLWCFDVPIKSSVKFLLTGNYEHTKEV